MGSSAEIDLKVFGAFSLRVKLSDSDPGGSISEDNDNLFKNIIESVKSLFLKARKKNENQKFIVVIGSSGAGKTFFVRDFLNDAGFDKHSLAMLDIDETRTQNNNTFSGEITITSKKDQSQKKSSFFMIDTPGHHLYSTAVENLIKSIEVGDFGNDVILINLVSYGFHETSQEVLVGDRKILYHAPSSIKKIDLEYLHERRKKEIEDIMPWLSLMDKRGPVSCIITLINKADLWHTEDFSKDFLIRDDLTSDGLNLLSSSRVINHYENGDYGKEISSKIAPSKQHKVLAYCTIVKRFYGIGRLSGYIDEINKFGFNNALAIELFSII